MRRKNILSIVLTTESNALYKTVISAYNEGVVMIATAGNNSGGVSEYSAFQETSMTVPHVIKYLLE